MATKPPITNLVKLADKERTFRERSVTNILKIVNAPNVPASLRMFTVLMLAMFVLFSFQFCILILHVIGSAFQLTDKVHPVWYVGAFGCELLAGTALAIPLIPRLGSFGEASRLKEDLALIATKKALRPKTGRVLKQPSDENK